MSHIYVMSRSVTCCDMFVTRCVTSRVSSVWAIHTSPGRWPMRSLAWGVWPIRGLDMRSRVAYFDDIHSHLPRLQNTRRFTQFHPREADSGEIIGPLMIFVNFHDEAFMAILKDSSTKRNSLLGKKLVKSTIITQHHLQRDRILWKCTWEASINNIFPTFTCLEFGKVFNSRTWVTKITVGKHAESNFLWMLLLASR